MNKKIIALIIILILLNTLTATAFNFSPAYKEQQQSNSFKQAEKSNSFKPVTPIEKRQESKPITITSKEVVGNAYVNESFKIVVEAKDPDDKVTAISLGRSPYGTGNWSPQSCSDYTCKKEWTIIEKAQGTYTYKIKAKNIKNQTIDDAITVTVIPRPQSNIFLLRTAAIDGKDFTINNQITYLNKTKISIRNNQTQASMTGNPFANFNIKPNELLGIKYEKSTYTSDEDYLFIDPSLQNCNSYNCNYRTGNYKTSCSYITSQTQYKCSLEMPSQNISFYYKISDPTLGNRIITLLNPLFQLTSPIVNFNGISPNGKQITFNEGSSYSLRLENYVFDDNPTGMTWRAEGNTNLNISFSGNLATITPKNSNWIGTEVVRFVAIDQDRNEGADLLTINVKNNDNDPPIITESSPTSSQLITQIGITNQFKIRATDPDFDLLQFTWLLNNVEVSRSSNVYNYISTQESQDVLTAVVSDGILNSTKSWTIITEYASESVAPTVSNLIATPNPQLQNQPVSITTNVIDNTRIKEVKLKITYPDRSTEEFLMNNVSSEYNYQLTNTNRKGNYTAKIIAKDIFNNVNDRITTTFLIRENNNPIIRSLAANPGIQEVNSQIIINFNIQDDSNTNSIKINIQKPDNTIQTIDITPELDNTYEYSYRTTNQLGNYQVTVIAQDEFSNRNQEQTQFTILDHTAPSVSNLVITPNMPLLNQQVVISSEITDNNQVSLVKATITKPDSTGTEINLVKEIGNTYKATFTDTNILGIYNVIITAKDQSNNINNTISSNFSIKENNNPIINEFTITPETQEVHNPILISISASDDTQIGEVTLKLKYPNGIEVPLTLTDLNNTYTTTLTNTNQLGTYELILTVKDIFNNEITSTKIFTIIDTTNPQLNNLQLLPSLQIQNNPVNIIVEASDNHEIDSAIATITKPDLTTENITLTHTVENTYTGTFRNTSLIRTYQVTITTIDKAGNIDLINGSFSIKEINLPIISNIIINPNPGEVSYPITINFHVEDDSNLTSVKVKAQHLQFENITEFFISPTKDYQYTYIYTEAPANTYIEIEAEDEFENTNKETVNLSIIDTIKPFIEFVSPTPENNTYLNASNIIINTNWTDNHYVSQCNLEINGVNETITNFSSPVDCSIEKDLQDGIYNYKMYAIDVSGNVNSTELRKLTIDTIVPSLNIINPVNKIYNTSNILLNILTNDINGISKTWYSYNNNNYTYTNPTYVNFPEGLIILTAYTNDSLGNVNSTSMNFTIDTIAPTIQIDNPSNGATIYTKQLLVESLIYDLTTGLNTCNYILDSNPKQTVVCNNLIILNNLNNGQHTLTISAKDNAGNEASNQSIFNVLLKGNVTGIVRSNSNVVPNALVELINGSGIIASTRTLVDGSYNLNALPGNYNIKFSKEFASSLGYVNKTESVTILGDEVVTHDAVLMSYVWWNTNWIYKKQLIINQTGTSNLVNFPLVVNEQTGTLSINTQSLIAAGHMKTNCSDLRFILDETTEIPFEFENKNDAIYGCNTQNTTIWLKSDIPITGKAIYMYYGNSFATNGENPNNVWDSNFIGVWHLGEGAGTTIKDSKGINNGVLEGTQNWTNGKIGKAINFNGINNRIVFDDNPSLNFGASDSFTIEAWIKTSSVENTEVIISKSGTTGKGYELLMESGAALFYITDGLNGKVIMSDNIRDNEWHQIIIIRDKNQNVILLYENGVESKRTSDSTGNITNTRKFYIGHRPASGTNGYFNGVIDEVRISNIARSPDWIKRSYEQGLSRLETEQMFPN